MHVRNSIVSLLLCRVQTRLCALPLDCVRETMRPLPIEPLPGAPRFVLGLAIVRGVLVPVVDATQLLGLEETRFARFVTLTVGDRLIALGVDAVLGVQSIPAESLQGLPPLLANAGTEIVAAIGMLDAELLLVLQGARIVPEDLWERFETDGGRAP